jgi:hypothetical protein
METDKKIMSAIVLSIIIYMLFMYNQMNTFKLSVKKDNDNIVKRLKNSEQSQQELFAGFEKVNNVLASATDSDKAE